jgi:membrane-associated phospholipid phosphatase
MDPIDETFSFILIILLIYKVIILKDDKRRDFIIRYLVLCILLETGKNVIGKLRPDKSDFRSFPSGHSSNVWFIAASYNFNIIIVIWAIAVSISRIRLRRHDLFDIIGGFILGTSCARLNPKDLVAYIQNSNYQNKL